MRRAESSQSAYAVSRRVRTNQATSSQSAIMTASPVHIRAKADPLTFVARPLHVHGRVTFA